MKWKTVSLGIALIGALGCGSAQETNAIATAASALTADCDLNGTWAMKFEIPVRWPATLAVETGEGTVYQWAKTTRVQDGLTFTDTVEVCGMQVPDTQASETFKRERYGFTFPDALFDSGKLPTFTVVNHLDGLGVGATFTTEPLAVLLGLTLDNPAQATWPTKGNQIQQIDADGDGHPGLTIAAKIAAPYTAPPVNMFRSKRAAQFYIAVRNVVESATAQLTSCDAANGSVTIPVINGKAAINSRIVGCQRVDGGQCTPSEHELVNKVQSGFDLAGTATVKMVRLAPGATCATVRGTTF